MTLAQLEALEERRAIEIRHARFNAALITSAILNAHKAADTRFISPFDFMPGFERDPEAQDEKRESIKAGIAVAFNRLPNKTTLAELQDLKGKMIERMKEQGRADAAEIFAEVFPNL